MELTYLPDLLNSCFELFGSAFILLSIVKVLKNKSSAGVNWAHPAFFNTWGFWNLFYYPHLEQWLSFIGGVGVVLANTTWVILLIKYRRS